VDVIARKSGLTKRTLYYLFRSKDDLLASVFEFHRGLALKRITDWAGTLLGGLDRVLDGLFANQPGRAEPAPASPASWS
jgi:AcrR family transcriptional regulator